MSKAMLSFCLFKRSTYFLYFLVATLAVDDDATVLVVLVEGLYGVALVVDRETSGVATIGVDEFLTAVLGAFLGVSYIERGVTKGDVIGWVE